jgi:hypothetical protein
VSQVGFASRFGTNPFSLGALVVALLIYSEVFHLSETHAIVASIPGTALGTVGVRWAIRKGERKWFAWTAFGLNFVPTLLGFIALLVYLTDLIPSLPY